MQRQLCKHTCTTVASVHKYFTKVTNSFGAQRQAYAFGKLTVSRPVREKQKPHICHGKLTTATNGDPLTEGK